MMLTSSVPPWRWLWFILAAGFVLRVGLGLSADWIYRTDEYIQYLEQAHRVVFGYGHIPWEYRLGVRNWMNAAPAIAVLWLCKAVGLGHPDYYVPAMIAAHSALSMLLPLGMYFFTRRHYSETAGRVALLFGVLWYELIIFAPRALSENYAAILIIAALGLAAKRAGVVRALFGGFLLGLALSLRVSYAPVVGIAGLAWLFVLPGRSRAALVGGGFAALLLWGAVDALTWGGWWSSFTNYMTVYAGFIKEIGEQGGLSEERETGFVYLQYLAATSFGIFPIVFVAACLAFRAHRFLLLLIGGGVLVHALYRGPEYPYSNVFIIIPLWLCLAAALFSELTARRRAWAAPMLTAATLITLAGYFAILPFTGSVYRPHRYFFYQHPPLAVSEFLSRQEDVRAIVYRCSGPSSGGGYYRLHHNAAVLSWENVEEVQSLDSGRTLGNIASYIVVCEPKRIDGFSGVFASDPVRVYANDNPTDLQPLTGLFYDVYNRDWIRLTEYAVEQGLIPDPLPPTPYAPDLE